MRFFTSIVFDISCEEVSKLQVANTAVSLSFLKESHSIMTSVNLKS